MFIFEMAKNISHRTIDRKLWLTVSSVCSRQKENEAEFIKPYGPDKNDKDRMTQRYVAALLVMNKPCPKTEKDIDKLKTFKLIGHRAIELGATIDDIKKLYNVNSGKEPAEVEEPKPVEKPAPKRTEKPAPKPVPAPAKAPRAPRSPINKKYITRLDKITESIKPNMYDNIPDLKTRYVSVTDTVYKACKKDIETYIKSYIRKSS